MASDLSQRIESIEAKARLIVERYARVRQSAQKAEERIAELERELAERDRLIEGLRRQTEYLKVTSVLTPDHRDVETTRTRLSELVREIDRCIDKLSL